MRARLAVAALPAVLRIVDLHHCPSSFAFASLLSLLSSTSSTLIIHDNDADNVVTAGGEIAG